MKKTETKNQQALKEVKNVKPKILLMSRQDRFLFTLINIDHVNDWRKL